MESFGSVVWNEIVPGFNSYPNCFQKVLQFLVASVVFHHDFIKKIFPSNHPIFTSQYWLTNKHSQLSPMVLPPINFYCPVTKLNATGIPPTIMILGKIDASIESNKQLISETFSNNNMVSNFSSMVGTSQQQIHSSSSCYYHPPQPHYNHHHHCGCIHHQAAISSSSFAAATTNNNNNTNNTNNYFDGIINEFGNKLNQFTEKIEFSIQKSEERMLNLMSTTSASSTTTTNENSNNTTTSSSSQNHDLSSSSSSSGGVSKNKKIYSIFDSSLNQQLQSQYNIPNCSSFNMWYLWHKGDTSNNIPPLKYLSQMNCKTKTDQNRLTKTKKVMTELINISLELGYVKSIKDYEDENIAFDSLKEVFDKSMSKFLLYLLSGNRSSISSGSSSDNNNNNSNITNTAKLSEDTCCTLYNYIPSKRKLQSNIKPNGNGISSKAKYDKNISSNASSSSIAAINNNNNILFSSTSSTTTAQQQEVQSLSAIISTANNSL